MTDLADSTVDPSRSSNAVSHLLQGFVDGRTAAVGVGPLATGFHPLDTVLDGGLLPGELVLLGGRPGVGKTLSALQWARQFCESGRRVAYCCFEHDEHALLTRLLVQELASVAAGVNATELLMARRAVRQLMLGVLPLAEALETTPVIREAFESLHDRAPDLHLLRASTQRSTVPWIDEFASGRLQPGDVVFVDYLQKLPVVGTPELGERIYRATEQLKELAAERSLCVIALSSASAAGIAANRLTLDQLRGADALAHECDIALVMNEKLTATSSRHLDYDLTMIDAARRHTVFSVEKNRRGETDVHLEFRKDFANYRFNPNGAFVAEVLED